jgi:ferredoxin
VRPALWIEADRSRCCGSGMCALLAGDLFDQDSRDGRVVLRHRYVPEPRRAAALECVQTCPCGALTAHATPAGTR